MLTRQLDSSKPVRIIPLKAFSDNYIWVIYSPDGSKVAVVDPGDSRPVIEFLEENELSLDSILVTHYHNDHIGGVQELKNRYHCHVYASRHDQLSFTDTELDEDDTVSLFDDSYQFSILHLPGHTMGHIGYFCQHLSGHDLQGQSLVFCGDTLFRAGCGRMFEGTPDIFHHSLQKLAQLPPSTLVYCTHEYTMANIAFAKTVEPDNADLLELEQNCQKLREQDLETLPSTIDSELRTNPFLRCTESTVIKTAERAEHKSLSDPVETFATIRQLKDNF
ncbi:hydroxyacylglutathione hydrolase [Kangiella koreensis]|uniref:hydroxyacylglutathione hydrolase n=1 Tax=Kangiella koreensis TaxID=261964 RepID=UPI00059CF0F3|nr:hydroxyacylglutathione hydrolase [Kangiella koreensis]